VRARRLLLWLFAGILLLSLLAAATVYWAGRSETALRWGIERIARSLPCSLTVNGIRGAFMKPVHVEYLACENTEYRVEARNVALVWSPWLLTNRRLDVTSLHLDALIYTSKTTAAQPQASQPPSPPADLALPIAIDIASLRIAELVIAAGNASTEPGSGESQPIRLTEIDASYRGDSRMHTVVVRSLASPWGRASGEASVGASRPMPVAATLTVSSEQFENWPLSADIGLSGELQKIDAVVTALAGPLQANAELTLTPFAEQPVQSVSASATNIDAAAIDARLPKTSLTVSVTSDTVTTQPVENFFLTGKLRADNAAVGPLDQQQLPIQRLDANFALDASSLRLSEVLIDLGKGGSASGDAQLTQEHITLALAVRDLDLRATHGALRETRLNGSIRLDHDGDRQRIAADLRQKDMLIKADTEVTDERITFERVTAQAAGAKLSASGWISRNEQLGYTVDGSFSDFDPARFGEFPQARLNGTLRAHGDLRPDWHAEVSYQLARSRLNGVALSGGGKARLSPSRVQAADMQLDYGGNRVKLSGSFGATGDALDFSIDAQRLDVLDKNAAGQILLSGTLSGTQARPFVTANLRANKLVYEQYRVDAATAEITMTQADDPAIRANASVSGAGRGDLFVDSAQARVDGTLRSHSIELSAAAPRLQLSSRLNGGWDSSRRVWSGTLLALQNTDEDYPFRITREASLELGGDRVLLGATGVVFSMAELALGETRYDSSGLHSQGAISGVRAARVLALMEKPPAVESTLVLGGRWEIKANETVDGFVELTRTDGDIVIPGEEPLALGMTQLRLTLRAAANRIDAEAVLRSAQIDANGSAQTRLVKRDSKLGIAGDAPLQLDGEMQMRSIRPVAALASRNVTADGRLKLSVKGSGTISQPRLSGTVDADDLKIENVANGVFFREGVLRASFGDDALELKQLRLKGGQGELTASGRFSARKGEPALDLKWGASQLAVVQHPELRLTVSGAGKLAYRDAVFSLDGELTADQGRVELRNRTRPALGDDVVISGQQTQSQVSAETKRANLNLKLDLGKDFTITGRGLDARMEGAILLTGSADKPLSADGEIRVDSGTFEAYGRRLQIEKGALYFAGPVNNPGLNIRAMRKNQPVEAGVEVTGTARDPLVRLVSDPEVPDPDKLAWLVLGRQAESSNTQDSQALQRSAVALAANLGTAPLQQQLARSVGLDEISLIPGSSGSEGGVVAVGKQISDRIYVTQEFGVSTASNTLRVTYQLARRWSVRTESGDTDAIDLFFTISFD